MATRKLLITGGAGFIGSALVRYLINNTDYAVINVDNFSATGNTANLPQVVQSPLYDFCQADICDAGKMKWLLNKYQPDGIINLAAETLHTTSLLTTNSMVTTNVVGTYTLLETTNEYLKTLERQKREDFRFIHVSTDEVYGNLGFDTPAATELSPYRPNNPYATSKASADYLVRSMAELHNIPFMIANCATNHGPYQFPESIVPRTIIRAILGQDIPVPGAEEVRDWIYVDDTVLALLAIFEGGIAGETYNIGASNEISYSQIVDQICDILDMYYPTKTNPNHRWLASEVANGRVCLTSKEDCVESYRSLVHPVEPEDEQPPFRYALNSSKLVGELGWEARETNESALKKTILWYIKNKDWWQAVVSHFGIMEEDAIV